MFLFLLDQSFIEYNKQTYKQTFIQIHIIVVLSLTGTTKEGGAGAVDEDDFIKAFTDVPTVQVR